MTTRTLSHRLQPERPLADRWLEGVQHTLARWLERRAERRQADLAVAVERGLQRLDPRTLADIGAPQGLIGQRRWQDEQDHWSRERLLRTHGW
jgi:hypothetical protein